MCVGSKSLRNTLTLAALAGAAYFSGGGSLAGMFGAKAGAAGSGLAASSVAPTAGVGAFTGASSAVPAALSSSGGLMSALTSKGLIGSALTFAKNNPYIIGQGLNLAGTAADYMSNRQMMNEMNKARGLANARNAGLITQAQSINQQSLDNFSVGNQNNMLDDAVDARIAALQGAKVNPTSLFLPDGGSAPKEVREANASRIAEIVDFGRNQLASSARLGAYGDVDVNNNIALSNSQQKIGTLQNFSQGNNSVLDSQLSTAMARPRLASTIGAGLKGAGMLSNIYASTRPRIA